MASGHCEEEELDVTPTEQEESGAKLSPNHEFVKSIPAPEEWKVLFATEDITTEMWRKAVRIGVKADRWLDAHEWLWKRAGNRRNQKILLQLIYRDTMTIIERKGSIRLEGTANPVLPMVTTVLSRSVGREGLLKARQHGLCRERGRSATPRR